MTSKNQWNRCQSKNTSQFEPEIEELLDRARHAEEVIEQNWQDSTQAEARLQRAKVAWLAVANYRGDNIPDDVYGESFYRAYAERIVHLGKTLRDDQWAEKVNQIVPESDAEKLAIIVLRKAIDGDGNAVIDLVRAMVQNVLAVGLDADGWLREGLRYKVLDIELPLERPLGWEGPYDDVATLYEFVSWLDVQIQFYDGMLSGCGNDPSDGRLVRNAYRLVDKLEIANMPEEPLGPFTLHDELTVLRNLKLRCRDMEADNREATQPNQGPTNEGNSDRKDECLFVPTGNCYYIAGFGETGYMKKS